MPFNAQWHNRWIAPLNESIEFATRFDSFGVWLGDMAGVDSLRSSLPWRRFVLSMRPILLHNDCVVCWGVLPVRKSPGSIDT
jgi:hypothetical protein